MPHGQLIINGQDAYDTWGLSMDSQGLSTLMTPPEVKEYVKNESALEDGTRVVTVTPKVHEREFSVGIHIQAITESAFLERYASFCNVLKAGTLNISTSFQSGVIYKCKYISCTTFAEYRLGLGKFILKLYEPNPTDRSSSNT